MRRYDEPPRGLWWMATATMLAVLWITGMLACFTSALSAQGTVAADSATLRVLAEWRETNDYERVACLAVRWESNGPRGPVLAIDSVLGYSDAPPCPEGTTGLAANATPDMPEDVALAIGQMLLKEYPKLILACALHSTKRVQFPDGASLLVPVVWCAHAAAP